MANLPPQERLQPALLDRLRDDHPEERKESIEERVFSVRRLRDSVIRDLEWLLNSENLTSAVDLEAYPEVAQSVVNYGIAGFSGRMISRGDVPAIEQTVREAIANFEPRIQPRSLKVRVSTDSEATNRNLLTIEIQGDLWAKPVPLEFFLVTEVDLETGNVAVAGSPS